MSKKNLIAHIANQTGLTKRDAENAYAAVVDYAKEELGTNGKADLHGLVNFKTVAREERKGRNPRTGEKIVIPAGRRVKAAAASNITSVI